MGKEILLREAVSEYGTGKGPKPVFVACTNREVIKQLFPDWPWFNLGLCISQKVLSYKKEKRPNYIVDIIQEMVSASESDRVIIDNIDLLFAPYYQLDVLKLFIQLGRNKKLIIMWDGAFRDGLLSSSVPELPDYHLYDIKNYDVYCLTK
ncbi:MAG: BREX-3 system P-loop-containing protein BrxF [Peptococcaceae bacterium]|nr:BREX-3 system P-loop-containing protein BrxF [Peptococcaceae bacterium]MDH7525910.1 BREX-3 system P-loop-containing protein BrxF [Peptococcaceae bacterium]